MPKKFSLLFYSALALLCSSAAGVHAASSPDQAAPMNIEADALMYDDKAQRSVFTGRVQLEKGSIRMRGQRLEAWQDAAGQQYGKLDGSAQALAFFRQQRPGVANEFVEAQAQRIQYDGKTSIVILTGQAQFKRLQGSSVLDSVSGHTIHYNGNTGIFTVNGSQPKEDGSPEASRTPSGRVRMTLSARKDEAATPASDSGAAEQPTKPTLQLRSEGGQP